MHQRPCLSSTYSQNSVHCTFSSQWEPLEVQSSGLPRSSHHFLNMVIGNKAIKNKKPKIQNEPDGPQEEIQDLPSLITLLMNTFCDCFEDVTGKPLVMLPKATPAPFVSAFSSPFKVQALSDMLSQSSHGPGHPFLGTSCIETLTRHSALTRQQNTLPVIFKAHCCLPASPLLSKEIVPTELTVLHN